MGLLRRNCRPPRSTSFTRRCSVADRKAGREWAEVAGRRRRRSALPTRFDLVMLIPPHLSEEPVERLHVIARNAPHRTLDGESPS